AGSTVVVSSSASPSVFGQSVTLTATVAAATPGSGTPTGVVTFTVDGAPQTPVVLSGGHATLVTSALGVGPHTVTAAFGGEPNFAMSTSSNFVQTVNKADTNTAIGS